ncbi:unnamed protein product [Effrenium voratum]|uniref:Uncharacterized protein n=1 Tax=Effrenium voratum TaxID=2562239 RepID=A0AA36J998_9DINO|nr:unnamed protein product [Effrenium voratum]
MLSLPGFSSRRENASPMASGVSGGSALVSGTAQTLLPQGASMRSVGPTSAASGFGDDSPDALAQWQTMVDSGFITEHVQVRIHRLLDLPRKFEGGRPLAYRIQIADDERVLGSLSKLGGKAPAQDTKETFNLTEREGTLSVKTSSVILAMELQFDDGSSIASCSLSRMDPRSAKKNTYSFEDERSSHPVCGVELTIFEGGQDLPDPQSRSRQTGPPLAPQGPPPGFPQGVGNAAPLPNKVIPPPSFSLGATPTPEVPPPPPLGWRGETTAPPRLSRELTLQVTQLLDMPSRPAQQYVVRVLDNLGQLAASKKVGGPDGRKNIPLNWDGHLPLRTESPFLTVQVEFADGTVIGSCQIYRPDQRSKKPSQYLLADPSGTSANCGIELQVVEGAGQASPNKAKAHVGGGLEPGTRVVGRLQLRVLAAFQLRDNAAAAPAVFVKATVGQTTRRTLTVEGTRDPVWTTSNEFTFPVTAADGELELEVINSSVQRNEPLGALSLGLWNVPSGQWLQRRERLSKGGELEYAFLFEPAQVSTQVPMPEMANKVAAPPAPPSALQHLSDGPYGGLPPGFSGLPGWHGEVPPGSLQVGDLTLPPLMAGWEAAFQPRPALRSVPEPPNLRVEPRLEEHQMLFPDMYHYVGDEHDAEELWLKPPVSSKADVLFGADQDMEVLARTAERWRAPVLAPVDLDVFHDKVFPDMDVGLVLDRRREMPARESKTKHKERRHKGLPDLPVDGWMENKPKPQLKAKDSKDSKESKESKESKLNASAKESERPPLRQLEGNQTEAEAKHVSPITEARSKRRRAKLKVERELVRPEQAKDIDQQLQSLEITSLDPQLRPDAFEAQVVTCLDVEDEGKERRVWVRTPSEEPTAMEVPRDNEWLEPFQGPDICVGISSRKGKRGSMDPLPCQDCYSLTKFASEVLYVVCDGHGPFGQLAAFRVAQSLPHCWQRLGTAEPEALVLAFRGASADLVTWAEAEAIDISSSGCTCSVALRQGSEVQVAWLGDSRAMVATVSETAKVDLVTTPHNTEDVKEMQRVRNAGAKLIQVPPNSGHVRIFTPGERTPGLFATRALGDTSGQALGISWQPHICKMSFARTPGLVMLGSGGLWEILDDRAGPGSEALQLLLGPCRLQECGACLAASQFSEEVQSKWSQAADGCSDDVSCILLHWRKAAQAQGPAPLTAQTQGPEPLTAQTQGPAPLAAQAQGPEPLTAQTQGPEPLTAQTQGPAPLAAQAQGPAPLAAQAQGPARVSVGEAAGPHISLGGGRRSRGSRGPRRPARWNGMPWHRVLWPGQQPQPQHHSLLQSAQLDSLCSHP